MRISASSGRGGCDRRAFLRIGSAGLLGLTLPKMLQLEGEGATRMTGGTHERATGVILIWLQGGPSTIDMWDMKPEAPEEVRGTFRPVATALPGVQVCEHLPRLAQILNRVTLVRSLHHVINDHGAGAKYVLTGRLPSATAEAPSLGSLAAALLPPADGIPAFITVGLGSSIGAGQLGPAYGPLRVDLQAGPPQLEGLTLPKIFPVAALEDRERLRRRLDQSLAELDSSGLPAELDRFQQQALDILRADKTRRALDVGAERPAVQAEYGYSTVGRGALAACRLIEAGARFVTLGTGDWDTHGSSHFRNLRDELLPSLDQALSALITDLDRRGLLARTIVYCVGEFGRTPRLNVAGGRDHWPGSMATILAGGGFQRGYVHGATDRLGTEPRLNPCTPQDVAATIFHRLGFEPTHRLATLRDASVFPEGRVLKPLLTT